MKISRKLITYWMAITLVLFFFQNLLVLTSVFVSSYPSGYITISTNGHGELIFEIISMSIITILSFIGIILIYKWEVSKN